MKVNHGVSEGFVPFTISVETEADAAILYAICNHSSIINGIKRGLEYARETGAIDEDDKGFDLRELRISIESAFAGGSRVQYSPFHLTLCKQFIEDYGK